MKSSLCTVCTLSFFVPFYLCHFLNLVSLGWEVTILDNKILTTTTTKYLSKLDDTNLTKNRNTNLKSLNHRTRINIQKKNDYNGLLKIRRKR